MGRTQANATAAQGQAQSGQNAQNAQQALSATNTDLTNYSNNLTNFMKFGRQTYGKNGEFMRDQNTLANTTASAGNQAIQGNLALNAMRTGANTANYANTAASSQRSAEQNLTNQLASADAQRLQNLTNINQYGVQASALPAQIQAQLYGTSTGGEAGNLGAAASASQVPGWWDTNGAAVVQAAGSAIASAV